MSTISNSIDGKRGTKEGKEAGVQQRRLQLPFLDYGRKAKI
jgi:hypothetical protein